MKFRIIEKADGRFIVQRRILGWWFVLMWGNLYSIEGSHYQKHWSEEEAKDAIVRYLERLDRKRKSRITLNTKVIEI